MKYFLIKVLIIYFFLVYFSFISIHAEDKNKTFSFDISANSGIGIGSGYEYVFGVDYITKSQLEWPLLPVAAASINFNFKIQNGFHFSFSSIFIIPSYSGQMFDYDYLNDSNPNMLTKFSEHKAYLRKGMDIGFFLGWRQLLKENCKKNLKVYIEPCLGFKFIKNSWDAVDGYKKYPPETIPPSSVLPDTPLVYLKGLAIRYTQTFFLPSIGLLFDFELPKNWKINLLTQLCPNAIGFAEDCHYMRNIKFEDFFNTKCFSVYLYLSAERRFSKYFSVFSSLDYTSIIAYNGKSLLFDGKGNFRKYPTGSAGTALHFSRINLGLIVHLGQ